MIRVCGVWDAGWVIQSFADRLPEHEYVLTPGSEALWRFLNTPGDHAKIRRTLRRRLRVEFGKRLAAPAVGTQMMAEMGIRRIEHDVAHAVVANLIAREMAAAQAPHVLDPTWGTSAGIEDEIAAYFKGHEQHLNKFAPGPLRDTHVAASYMFHTAMQTVLAGLTAADKKGIYAELEWLPRWYAATAKAMAPYAQQFVQARENRNPELEDPESRFWVNVDFFQKLFEARAADPMSEKWFGFAQNGLNGSLLVAAWHLAKPQMSAEESAAAALGQLQQVVLPASSISRKLVRRLESHLFRALQLSKKDSVDLTVDDVVRAESGKVVVGSDGLYRWVDDDYNQPPPTGDHHCAGNMLGPSGQATSVISNFYSKLGAAVSPDRCEDSADVGFTPSPISGNRDATFFRPVEIFTATLAVAAHRNGLYPALTAAHNQQTQKH